jgi:hypothetical protein
MDSDEKFNKYLSNIYNRLRKIEQALKVRNENNTRPVKCNANNEKIYCGSKCNLPTNYTRFGTPYECLVKGIGVGIGQEQQKKNAQPKKPTKQGKTILN